MLCLCSKDPNSTVDSYKDFTQLLRRKEFEEPLLLIDDNSTKTMKRIFRLLIDIKLDYSQQHVYYGEVKTNINSFLNYYTTMIDEILKDAEDYSNTISKDDLKMLIDKTIIAQQIKQDEFRKTFLPINSEVEKHVFEELEEKYEEYMLKLNDLREFIYIGLDKQSKIDDFAKAHFPLVSKKMSELFDTAQLYFSMYLEDYLRNTRVSLEAIVRRLSKNLIWLRKQKEENISHLVDQLYDKNKECMTVTRSNSVDLVELAEVNHGVDQIKQKMKNYRIEVPIERLEREVKYWTTKLDYFNEISNNIVKLKAMQKQLDEDQQKCRDLKCPELPGCQHECNELFRVAFSKRREEIKARVINETRALFTFYAVRGTDRIFYTDNIGPYYVDEFNHQNYLFDYGLTIYHLDCDGAFNVFPERAYYFDTYGRYIMEDGEKFYQCAPCTSLYKLNEANYLDKVSKDCGHSEEINKRCHVDVTDPNDVAILPDFDPIDIRRTLDTETVRYLWDSFGCVLPEALHDVAISKPKNPIHFIAHKLLYHKYKRTTSEHQKKKRDAEQYRSDIFQQRKEKAETASKKWKSKQVKRPKPEDFCDAEFKAYFDARVAQDLFINSLNMEF